MNFKILYSKYLSFMVRASSLFLDSNNKLLIGFEKKHLKALYDITNQDYKKYLQEYTPLCDFFNFSKCNKNKYIESNGYRIDEQGIPQLYRNGKYVYNTVVICQYAFVIYGQYLSGYRDKGEFLRLADSLCDMQEKDGRYSYYYDFPYYLSPNYFTENGWTGAMQHGQVLSVMARAYSLKHDDKYVKCAERIIKFLRIAIDDGGVKGNIENLDKDVNGLFYEEYPVIPESYTLNGYIFTLIGLYDWGKTTNFSSSSEALTNFEQGVESLKKILHLYDFDGATSYDLGHITYGKRIRHYLPDYHAIHIAQCLILYQLTGEHIFEEYAVKWKGLIE